MEDIIGRTKQIAELERLYNSGKSEFVAVYGRRRVGKTFLVRELFRDRMAFYHTAISPIETEVSDFDLHGQQLAGFYSSLKRYGSDVEEVPKDWFEAFECLSALLETHNKTERLVVFIDELPWMDSAGSGFVSAFEHFWNGWADTQKNVMLIVCGSAASWISDNLLNNHCGLYGRVTAEIRLEPFTLHECECFLKSRGVHYDRYDIVLNYMIMGGIPYYMESIEKGQSLAQNVDSAFFSKGAKFRYEFDRLYRSLFADSEKYMAIVRLLATRRDGFTRKEIAEKTGIPYNGRLTTMLRTLEVSDFIASYTYFGGSARDVYYKLIDQFSLFYLKFIDGVKPLNPKFWAENLLSPSLNVWRGFSFEALCMVHVEQIKAALGISGVRTISGPWRSRNQENMAQVDLVISRADRLTNLCEMKFTADEFSVDSSYEAELRRKVVRFAEETKAKGGIISTLVTTYGLQYNQYSGRFEKVVTMDDLFREL